MVMCNSPLIITPPQVWHTPLLNSVIAIQGVFSDKSKQQKGALLDDHLSALSSSRLSNSTVILLFRAPIFPERNKQGKRADYSCLLLGIYLLPGKSSHWLI